MIRLASSLISRFRLAKNSIQQVGRSLSGSSNSVAQDIPTGIEEKLFKDYKFSLSRVYRTSDIETPTCNVPDDCPSYLRALKYTRVLRRALRNNGFAALALGVHGRGLRTGIELAYGKIIDHFKHIAQNINSSEEIVQIATTVGGRMIGDLMAMATDKVGKDGLFLEGENTMINELEVTSGMELCWIYECDLSVSCINVIGLQSVLKNPLILIHEDTVMNKNVVMQAIRRSINYGRPLLIVSKGVTSAVKTFFQQKQELLGIQVCFIVPPYGEKNKKAIMQDLAIFTRSQVVTDVSDMNSIPLMLGSCKEARISFRSTIILGGSGKQENIEERCEQLRSTIKMSTSCTDEIKLLKDRIVNLSRGAAIIKVGGANTVEELENQSRFGWAMVAIKYATSEGIVPGNGVAFLHALKELDKLEVQNHSQKLGVKLMQHVIKIPVYSIASTAGFDGSAVVEKLLEQDNPFLGFDPATGEYVDMIKSINIDLFRFIIEELDNVVGELDANCERSRAYERTIG